MDTHIVIMAGGVGNRLYPLSTPEHPKQFLDLLGCGRTMIQLTYERFRKVDPSARFWVVTGAGYVHFVREQLPDIPEDQILAEPQARNTAPCIAYACRKIASRFGDANVIVTPADAYVPDAEACARGMKAALDFTSAVDAIVCAGIRPTEPNTGYGYIKVGAGLCDLAPDKVLKVSSFKEKPDLETARRYLSEGGYYWNAGIFVFRASFMLRELSRYAPQICAVMDELEPHFFKESENERLAALFPTCEKISIDYAVMERSEAVYMLVSCWDWSDLGSIGALEQVLGRKVIF